MFFIQKEYVKYLISSTNEHGVHSPFIFDFVTKCIYSRPTIAQKEAFDANKNRLLKNNEFIKVTDFCIGRKGFKDGNSQIYKTEKVRSMKRKYGLLLMRVIEYFNVKKSLELVTSLAVPSFCMSNVNSEMSLTTLEGCPSTLRVAKENLSYVGMDSIKFILGQFPDTMVEASEIKSYDFIFFAATQSKGITLEYFKSCLEVKHNDSIFIFDDIHCNKEMLEAWKEVKLHPEVVVTIDLFQWGVVFFRKEQRKEHFKIRF
jgi:predicted O-methyltransferase YrrM